MLNRITCQAREKGTFMTPESAEQDIRDNAATGRYVKLGIFAPGGAVPFPFRGRRTSIALELRAPPKRCGKRLIGKPCPSTWAR